MDRKIVGAKLLQIRESKFPERSGLRKATGLSYAQIQDAEEGLVFPRLDLLERWLHACGTSLSKFFADLEKQRGTHKEISIVPGFEEFYENLTKIIESDQDFYIKGIQANLKSLARTAEEEAAVNTQKEGNLKPKEKKKRAVERKAG